MTAAVVRLRPLRGLDGATVGRWQGLAERAAEANPFAGPAVALAAARHLYGGDDARLLSVEHDGAMTFALPVAYERAGPLPVLEAWQALYPPLATPLLDPDHGRDAWRAVRAALPGRTIRAAWLLLDPVPDDGAVVRAAGAGTRVLHRAERAYAYRDGARVGVSDKTRKSLAARRRKLGRMAGGEPETFRIAPGEDVPEALVEDFLKLEASGWKGREGTALGSHGDTAAFFRDLVRGQAARGGLEIVGIRCGERLVAATVNLVAGRGLFFYKIAYDEEFHTASPGRILMADALDAFAGADGLDFADSCADPGASLSNQALHDRRTVGTVLVPASGGPATATVRAALLARAARRRLRSLRRRS